MTCPPHNMVQSGLGSVCNICLIRSDPPSQSYYDRDGDRHSHKSYRISRIQKQSILDLLVMILVNDHEYIKFIYLY